MKTPHTIAVLGLGRMGTTIATRLADQGWPVVTWTRSGRALNGIDTVRDPAAAAAIADVLILALFDGPACRQVVDQAGPSLRTDKTVVNISTIAPTEATSLAQHLGNSYVHAPVLGSVPAAATGTLQILAAADHDVLHQVQPLLETLGTVHGVDDAATAAALKLIANSTLAGSVLALRSALQQADALSLPRAQVLDVLELGQLGHLVSRKRPFLTDRPTPEAEFTIGALTKDMALLAATSNTPLRYATDLSDTPADPNADIAVAASAPALGGAVLQPLHAYQRGHATGNPAHFRDAFLPTAHIEGLRDGTVVSWTLDEYCALFPGHPAPNEPTRTRRINDVTIYGTIATASMTLQHGPDTFTDIFLLIQTINTWRITNKAYHRHPTGNISGVRPADLTGRRR